MNHLIKYLSKQKLFRQTGIEILCLDAERHTTLETA